MSFRKSIWVELSGTQIYEGGMDGQVRGPERREMEREIEWDQDIPVHTFHMSRVRRHVEDLVKSGYSSIRTLRNRSIQKLRLHVLTLLK